MCAITQTECVSKLHGAPKKLLLALENCSESFWSSFSNRLESLEIHLPVTEAAHSHMQMHHLNEGNELWIIIR